MKPHPKLRKTIKWGGAAVTVVLMVVWIGSRWWQAYWLGNQGGFFDIARGSIRFGVWQVGTPFFSPGLTISRIGLTNFNWCFSVQQSAPNWAIQIPLWAFVGLVGTAAAAAWRFDTLARRLARLNLCPKCNYDRAGIGAGAACPECGDRPTAA
jgi:hypothetical protein